MNSSLLSASSQLSHMSLLAQAHIVFYVCGRVFFGKTGISLRFECYCRDRVLAEQWCCMMSQHSQFQYDYVPMYAFEYSGSPLRDVFGYLVSHGRHAKYSSIGRDLAGSLGCKCVDAAVESCRFCSLYPDCSVSHILD